MRKNNISYRQRKIRQIFLATIAVSFLLVFRLFVFAETASALVGISSVDSYFQAHPEELTTLGADLGINTTAAQPLVSDTAQSVTAEVLDANGNVIGTTYNGSFTAASGTAPAVGVDASGAISIAAASAAAVLSLQNKAESTYCTAHPSDSSCQGNWRINYSSSWEHYGSFPSAGYDIVNYPVSIVKDCYPAPGDSSRNWVNLSNGWQPHFYLPYGSCKVTITKVFDSEPNFSGWPAAKQQAALDNLTGSDYMNALDSTSSAPVVSSPLPSNASQTRVKFPNGGIAIANGKKVKVPAGGAVIIPVNSPEDSSSPATYKDPFIDTGTGTGSSNPSPSSSNSPSPSPSPSSSPSPAPGDNQPPSPPSSPPSTCADEPFDPPEDTPDNQTQKGPGSGVAGNGTASEFGTLTGMTRQEVDTFLRGRGANVKYTRGNYIEYTFPDKSKVFIRPSGEIVRTPAPKYGADGSNIVKGRRLDKDGSLLQTLDQSGNQITGTHTTGEKVSN